MPMDFTVILMTRNRFGSESGSELGFELEAPWVGGSVNTYSFACPGVDIARPAVLQLESLGMTGDGSPTSPNSIFINTQTIPGGLKAGAVNFDPVGRQTPVWKTHSLIVPENVLRANEENFLTIVAGRFGPQGPVDGFIVDNIVLFYKTGSSTIVRPSKTASGAATAGRSAKR